MSSAARRTEESETTAEQLDRLKTVVEAQRKELHGALGGVDIAQTELDKTRVLHAQERQHLEDVHGGILASKEASVIQTQKNVRELVGDHQAEIDRLVTRVCETFAEEGGDGEDFVETVFRRASPSNKKVVVALELLFPHPEDQEVVFHQICGLVLAGGRERPSAEEVVEQKVAVVRELFAQNSARRGLPVPVPGGRAATAAAAADRKDKKPEAGKKRSEGKGTGEAFSKREKRSLEEWLGQPGFSTLPKKQRKSSTPVKRSASVSPKEKGLGLIKETPTREKSIKETPTRENTAIRENPATEDEPLSWKKHLPEVVVLSGDSSGRASKLESDSE